MNFCKTAARVSLAVVVSLGAVASAAAFGTDQSASTQRSSRVPALVPAYQSPQRVNYASNTASGANGERKLGHGILPMRDLGRKPVKQHGVLPFTRSGPPPAAAPQHGIIRQSAARPNLQIDPVFLPRTVSYATNQPPGTIVIDTEEKFLYLVKPGGKADRYGVGVGRPGFEWAGTHRVSQKREWPGWTPPPQMRKRQPELPAYMPGGPENPLGARALYLGSTLYRIHGSNAPWTIGHAVSSGCIRMRNEDVIELYEKVKVGTKVVVLR